METAELLQMGNYGVGGQYEPHWDHQAYPGSDNQWSEETGSRIGNFESKECVSQFSTQLLG